MINRNSQFLLRIVNRKKKKKKQLFFSPNISLHSSNKLNESPFVQMRISPGQKEIPVRRGRKF